MTLLLGFLLLVAIGFTLAPANMITVGHKWREKTETVAATTLQTIDFSTLMPEYAVSAFTFVVTGANNSFGGAGVDSYLAKLGTGTWLDIKSTELRSLLDAIFSRYGGDTPATADLNWIFPLHLMNILIPDLAVNGQMPEVGLPSDTTKIWQTFLNAVSSSAGGITIGWLKSQRVVTHIPYLQGHAVTGLAASTNNQIYKLPWQPLPTAGFTCSLGATTFSRIRLYNPNEQGVIEEVFDTKREHLLILPSPYMVVTLTDPMMIMFGKTITIRPGAYMMVDGGAGIDGTQRFVPIQFIPVASAIPGLPNGGAK